MSEQPEQPDVVDHEWRGHGRVRIQRINVEGRDTWQALDDVGLVAMADSRAALLEALGGEAGGPGGPPGPTGDGSGPAEPGLG